MKKIYTAIVLISALMLSGCGLRVSLRSELDPAYAPKMADPIAIIFPDNPTIEDRQIDPAFKRQLNKMGFTVVEPAQAKWIMGITTHEDTYFSGVKSMGIGGAIPLLGGPAVVGGSIGSSTAEYESRVSIYCLLFSAKEYLDGKRVPIWAATEKTSSDDFWENTDTLAHGVLQSFAKNSYDDSDHIKEISSGN